jgi:hypothetical protein
MSKLVTIFGKYAGVIWVLLLVWIFTFFAWVFRDLTLINTEVNIAFATAVSLIVIVVRILKELSR